VRCEKAGRPDPLAKRLHDELFMIPLAHDA
jgi:hypothetical protein